MMVLGAQRYEKVINYIGYFVILVIKLDVKSWKTMCRPALSMHGLIHLHPDSVSGSGWQRWTLTVFSRNIWIKQTDIKRYWHPLRTTSLSGKKPIQTWGRIFFRPMLAEWLRQNGERSKKIFPHGQSRQKVSGKGQRCNLQGSDVMLDLAWGFMNSTEEMEYESTAYHMSNWNHIYSWYFFWTKNQTGLPLIL